MRQIFTESKRAVGTRGLVENLALQGFVVGRKRVRRLMKADGKVAKRTPKARRVNTTDSRHRMPVAENLLQRNFSVASPNTVWSGDITYIRTLRGFVYVAVVMDLCSRRIIGWHVSENITQELTITALRKAWTSRKRPTGMILHSDRGVQYAAGGYRAFLEQHCKARQSMSRKGDCWDNAPVESFFATFKIEGLDLYAYDNIEVVRREAFRFIERYNHRRLHSTLGYLTPVQFEEQDPIHNTLTKKAV